MTRIAPPGGGRASKKTTASGGASRPSSVAALDNGNGSIARTRKESEVARRSGQGGSSAFRQAEQASETAAALGAGALALRDIRGLVVYNDSPNPVQAPYVVPGVRATRAENTYLNSDITVLAQPENALPRMTNWGFRFHYNPETISESVQTNYTIVPDQNDVGNVLGTGMGAMSFKFLINRMEDVAARRPLVVPMLGKKNFYDLGTLYDLEFLYRTINGDPQSPGIKKHGPAAADPNGTANLGFLYMTAVRIRFNNIKFLGFITNIDIDHQMFSDKMVPVLTYVTISATRYLSGSSIPGQDQSAASDPANPPPVAKPKSIAPKRNGPVPGQVAGGGK